MDLFPNLVISECMEKKNQTFRMYPVRATGEARDLTRHQHGDPVLRQQRLSLRYEQRRRRQAPGSI